MSKPAFVPPASLVRYAPIVDDFEAFIAACARPLARVVWANPLRGPLELTRELLLEACPAAEPIAWAEAAWRLPEGARPGNWLPYKLGLLHAQEEAALWAAPLLQAAPGERVLDLCAAPGNKTAQLAIAMQNRGLLVANERQHVRLDALRFNLERLGVENVVVSHQDGHNFVWDGLPFDRVLADVPCSCEGTLRKPDGNRREHDEGWLEAVSSTQVGLLRKAVEMTRPGGTVLYSTCTFAPEENERVLDSLRPGVAVIEPLEVPDGLVVSPGVTEWDGRQYRPDVANARRVWPHHNDTGGFFVARIRRV